MSPSPILVAEGNPRDVELILEAFAASRLANPVDVVSDGVEALEYLRRQGRWTRRAAELPALALLDLRMPRLDGLETLQRIKRDPSLHQLPVVILTSSRDEQDLARGYEYGANAYVQKPPQLVELVQMIADLGRFWMVVDEPPPLVPRA